MSILNIYFSQYALLSSNVIFCYLKYRLDRYGYYQIHTLTTDPMSISWGSPIPIPKS